MEPANASDRKSIRRQEKAARLAERQREDVVRSIMSTAPGRAWLWDVLSSTSMFHTTFNGDALAGAFAEGRRSVGLAILADIMRACPDSYIQAMREQNERYLNPDRTHDRDASFGLASSERPSGSLPDGGDSGALSDSADDDDDTSYTSPGADIYTR